MLELTVLSPLALYRKETHCEFCDCELPDWKNVLTPQCGANAPAVMNVNFDGRTYSFEVKPGPEGYRQFTEAIRRAFSLPDDSELNITFTCDEPSTTGWEEPPSPGMIHPLPSTSLGQTLLSHNSVLMLTHSYVQQEICMHGISPLAFRPITCCVLPCQHLTIITAGQRHDIWRESVK